MYLFSHLATSINVAMINLKKTNTFISENYQLRMVMKGSLSIEGNDGKYILQNDDIILLQPNIHYKLEAISENNILDISIPVNFFQSMIKQGFKVVCNSAIGRRNDYISLQNIMTDIVVYYNKVDNHLKMCSLIYSLMDCINDKFLVQKKQNENKSNDMQYLDRIDKITSYINTNYPLPLNLQTLADYMFLTPQYLSKFIKQIFGLNFNRYLNNVRMNHAIEELKETDHSIITIAFNNGFASTTSFNKIFKETFNITPTAYRQSLTNTLTSKESLGNEPSKNIENVPALSSYYEKEIDNQNHNVHSYIIDSSINSSIEFPWFKIINFGLAQNILSHNFRQIFIECQEKLQFEYARFESIFSDKIFSLTPNSSVYNFTNFDDIMNFLVRCKIYPLIELGNKPQKVFYTEGDINGSQKDTLLHDEIIQKATALDALLKHSINHYGIDYVSHWKFELWVPQDENLTLLITPKEYVKGYLAYSNVIKKYLPSISIGGPGYNTSGNIENFINILKEFSLQGIVPGFISTYLFPYEPGAYVEPSNKPAYRILSPDPGRFKKVLTQLKGYIHELFSVPVPIYVTVYNSNISPEIFVANSAFQAAFICKNALDLLSDADALAYWLFTDISNEYVASQTNALAGIGLIDSYGIKKPSYFAFEFLSKLGNNLINYGPNYIMTSSHDNKYQILAYNYVHYNKYFCINCRDKIEYQNTYSVFEPGEKITLQFNLTSLPPGRYKVRKHILSRSNGSFLDEFIKMLEQGNFSPEELLYMMLNMQIAEVDYYKSICIPKQEIIYANCEDNLNITITLEPHEVNYISISRKL
jgi:Beta-xylosidase